MDVIALLFYGLEQCQIVNIYIGLIMQFEG